MNNMTRPTTDTVTQFVGSIPAAYDTHLGPLLFQFSAADLARRVSDAVPGVSRILEVACGTGISTEYLWQALAPGSEIVATDLNDAMLDYASAKRGALGNVSFQQADAQDLPFDDGGFDAVVCQFGIMFMPDKAKAFAEMARMLRPGGLLAFNVWDSLDNNAVAKVSRDTIASFFETDPPDFLSVPFGFHDIAPSRTLARNAGFSSPEVHTVSETIERPDALTVARGFVEGNPTILQINERDGVDSETIVGAVATAIEALYGPAPLQVPLQEIVFLARKP
ncbi:MAG: class I SAM-dependent methyltransferase [Rhodospirillaceae bacterium]|nr:class I SAM-dependent methyltransferase [Rhodospirillaceae bacterium]MBT4488719.1 class I SAM-dependent methyltransferase [Rhodospirillaceae bacterium]MBT5896159.1 class I SAM-dependent methyltransferase [Rhodospirillaceae bacterium]MBT6431138.1 class I SAM-dependent methyltransferase [Rhodospirillaceae bacterium]